ncbi:uncharacterized protein [Panulirus ornatus]|uniref:uncharacterized protein n=1 Tax=Panulirus ornatus TaxID=150431 RepID=UPI003A8560C3
MIGAMPAVAVRQQRKHVRHEEQQQQQQQQQQQHKHRPNTLTIEANSSFPAKPPGSRRGLPTPLRSPRGSPRTSPHGSPNASPKHSPAASPKAAQPKGGASSPGCAYRCVHGYLCGRVSLLHVSVVCVLLGITLLVVGLVQLAPGAAIVSDFGLPAGSEVNKYAIIGAGTGFLGLGFLLLIILCACQKNTHRRRRPPQHVVQSWGTKRGKEKTANVYAMDCVTSMNAGKAHSNHKGKGGSGKGSKSHSKGQGRQMQVHTIEGAVAAACASSRE